MNLIYYSVYIQEKTLSINNIEFKEFFQLFHMGQNIAVNNLFAHSPTKEYNELDFPKSISIAELKRFKDENKTVFIDRINLSINLVEVNISDEYTCRVTSVEPQFSDFVSRLLKLKKIDNDTWATVQENTNKYILVENSKVICIFSSFDEYLQSDYSSLL